MLAQSNSRKAVVPLLTLLLLLNGTAVSTLYWAQSVAGSIRLELGISPWVGVMPSAALIGYAVGVALLAVVVRDLTAANGIGLHALLLAAGLGTAAMAPSAPTIALACFVVGIGCSLTQRMLATATGVVPAVQRGPVIGGVIASGLAGIVAARAVVPVASAALGWRIMFVLNAVVICAAGLAAAAAALRINRENWSVSQVRLPSALALWRSEPVVRRAAMQQAFVFGLFNAGWAIFPRVLAQAGVPGAVPMGAVASVGAGAALVAGWCCRRTAPARVALVGLGAVLVAAMVATVGSEVASGAGPMTFAVMVLLDVGTQTALVANQAQAQAQGTTPAMRGRIAAIVTTVGFGAGAAGAALGNMLF